MIIDTHAHLYYESVLSDIDGVLSRAKDSGIEKIIAPAVDLETSRQVLDMSSKYDMIYCTVGFHPCDVQKADGKSFDEIIKLCAEQRVVAIGETGLDYYWDLSQKEKQHEYFKLQIELAVSVKKPVVIHSRSSIRDCISVVKENLHPDLTGHFHCLSGEKEDLNEILSLENFYVSYCGNVTFKKFEDTELVKNTPVDRILSETDSPFLTPVPFRGKQNEPSYIIHTIKKIAEMKEVDEIELTERMFKNAMSLYFKNEN